MKPTNEQWNEIQKRFIDKGKRYSPEEFEVIPFRACDASYNVSHGMKLSTDFVKGYAGAMNEGVALTVFHENNYIPVGKSFYGEYDESEESAKGLFYIKKGLNVGNGLNTTDVAEGIQVGNLSDVSIEFFPGGYECSICGASFLGDGCEHVIGKEYDGEICAIKIPAKGSVYGSLSAVAKGSIENASALPHGEPSVPGTTEGVAAGLKAMRLSFGDAKMIRMSFARNINSKEIEDMSTEEKKFSMQDFVKEFQTEYESKLLELTREKEELSSKIEKLEEIVAEQKESMAKMLSEKESSESEKGEWKGSLLEIMKEFGIRAMGNDFAFEMISTKTPEELLKFKEECVEKINAIETSTAKEKIEAKPVFVDMSVYKV